MKQPCVYVMTNKPNGTLYTGVTSNLVQRVCQHKNDLAEGFTKRYGTLTMVWYETHDTMSEAITRERESQGMEQSLEAGNDFRVQS